MPLAPSGLTAVPSGPAPATAPWPRREPGAARHQPPGPAHRGRGGRRGGGRRRARLGPQRPLTGQRHGRRNTGPEAQGRHYRGRQYRRADLAGAGEVLRHGRPPQAAWRFRTGNAVDANPGAGGGLAYVGSSDNNVYAVSLATGKKAWSFPAASVTAAPELIGGVVCLATSDEHFYALDAASGKQAWSVSSAVPAISKRTWTSAGRQVIVARSGAAAQAYDAATGTRGASFATQEPYVTTLTAAGGVLYALDANGILYAFRIADGTELWHRQLLSGSSSDTAGTSLAVAGGSLYLGSTAGTVYAVGAATGRQRWTYHPGSGLYADLALSAGVVYLKDNNGTVHALSAVTGKALWTRAATETGFYGLTAAGGTVYYTTALALQALDARTGRPDLGLRPVRQRRAALHPHGRQRPRPDRQPRRQPLRDQGLGRPGRPESPPGSRPARRPAGRKSAAAPLMQPSAPARGC